jgi:hypothetical protein
MRRHAAIRDDMLRRYATPIRSVPHAQIRSDPADSGNNQDDPPVAPLLRHASEQYFTCSHVFAHFLRHVNGRPHAAQVLTGN